MRRESYLSQPSAVEVYPVFSGTDVIMRKNIELVDKEDIQDGKKNKYKVWECEEVQFHYQGKVTQEEIESDFDYWYAKAEEVPDPSSVEDLSLEDARKAKYQEIASACEQTIYAGVDVSTSSGVEHFSLTEKDQLNLFGKKMQLLAGGENWNTMRTDILASISRLRTCRTSSIKQCSMYHTTQHIAMP